jgi:hypothetical protein
MTPQERALVTELFDRLAMLETACRDPEAERLIADGLARAPNATYALVQTVLLQDEALKRADAHIRELENSAVGTPAESSGFLDSLRNQGLGRGSVPSVPPASKWNIGRQSAAPPSTYAAPAPTAPPYAQEPGRGGSFLGTAAAAAVGVIGGSLLFNGLSNMMGGAHAQSFGAPRDDGAAQGGPWGGDASHGELARDAGVNNIGGGSASRPDDSGGRSAGLLDGNADDNANDSDPLSSDNDGFDSGGDGGVSDA